LHRVLDAVDVLLLLFLGIGVVEAHVAHAAVVARQAEVQADALGVAHVQVAVGLGREAGADRYFSPRRPLFGMRTNLFRRLHRKLVAVDREIAFIGGINFSVQHLHAFGPLAKQDYAVEVDGALAGEIHDFLAVEMGVTTLRRRRPWLRRTDLPPAGPRPGATSAMFITRDNDRHRTDIEREYLHAIRGARSQVLIANAYFLPGHRVIHALCEAARRGVDVRILMQGKPDMPWVSRAALLLYEHMQDAGVRIFEYGERPFHGKVAVVDDDWSTVGSSNLDPLSLSLNLEANVVIRDAGFARHLHANLSALMARSCREIPVEAHPRRAWVDVIGTTLIFHFLRRFPAWAGWLPAHAGKLVSPRIAEGAEVVQAGESGQATQAARATEADRAARSDAESRCSAPDDLAGQIAPASTTRIEPARRCDPPTFAGRCTQGNE
jgi:cardiolipin synthase